MILLRDKSFISAVSVDNDQYSQFSRRLEQFSAQVLLRGSNTSVSYADLLRSIDGAARELKAHGLESGEVVAMEAEFHIESIARWLAATKLGMIAALLSPTFMQNPRHLSDVHAGWRWERGEPLKKGANASGHPLLQELRDRHRPGLALFSGGTSDSPKAILHDAITHISARACNKVRNYRLLSIMPMAHAGGLDALTRLLWAGGSLVVAKSSHPQHVAAAMVDGAVEVLVCTPSFLNLLSLAELPADELARTLRTISCGAEALPREIVQRTKGRWPNVRLLERFGTTEVGSVASRVRTEGDEGFTMDLHPTEYRVADGELWVRSKAQMLGYLNSPGIGIDADGWIATGDLVEQTVEGRMRVIGRRSSVVNVGGIKVHPETVELALLGTSGVVELRAVGERHAIIGEAISLDVVSAPGANKAEIRSRLRHAARALLPERRPVQIRFVAQLPTTAAGKRPRTTRVDRRIKSPL